jgi:cell division protease FtsH
VESQYQRALKLLTENKDKLALLAEKLLTHEVIFKEDLVEIFGKRPWEKEEEQVVAEVTEEPKQIEENTANDNEISEDKPTEGNDSDQKDQAAAEPGGEGSEQ